MEGVSSYGNKYKYISTTDVAAAWAIELQAKRVTRTFILWIEDHFAGG